ncbi:MAG: DNA replication/repair protein RecF [Bacteroidales bacterium]|nr:DNA replication/repair protein RecF [Bacteroidales bacterium]
MYLQRLSLNNFKNYAEAEMQFSDKINCFIGNNGAGKTNILDAIYYLSFCKSYFNAVDQQNIRHDEAFFSIHGYYRSNGNEADQVSCIQRRNQKKQFRLNKKEYERLADHIGKIPLVMISPYDRDLINEGSEVRRKFIDGVIAQFDPVYLNELISYNKALLQRNTLLRQFAERHQFDRELLRMYDQQLEQAAAVIYGRRAAFLDNFVPLFTHYYAFVSGGKEEVDIVYESGLHQARLGQLLEAAVERDRLARFTTVGIHKDDLDLRIAGFPLKKFGSQGQQKSFVIAIKLAQFDYTRNIMQAKPVLLFDDIFDKLDDNRVEQLIRLVSNNSFGQVFITDTQRQRIERLFRSADIDHRIFEVEAGRVAEA